MATLDHPYPHVPTVPDWMRLEPVRFQQALLDGCRWPSTNDLEVEHGVLVPALDRVRGPVAKLLLSPAPWTPRPDEVVAAGRTIAVDAGAVGGPLHGRAVR